MYIDSMAVTEFACNICQSVNRVEWETLFREGPSCEICGSSVRMREIVDAFLALVSKGFRFRNAVGLSDVEQIATFFAKIPNLNYTNTFLDTEPRLDISNVGPEDSAKYDLIISSDIFEHVFFPLRNSLKGCFDLLTSKGVLICTMPWNTFGNSIEHYPWMRSYNVHFSKSGEVILIGIDADGNKRIIKDPIFHGGPGNTLEMRRINVYVLIDALRDVGFQDFDLRDMSVVSAGIRRADGVVGTLIAFK